MIHMRTALVILFPLLGSPAHAWAQSPVEERITLHAQVILNGKTAQERKAEIAPILEPGHEPRELGSKVDLALAELLPEVQSRLLAAASKEPLAVAAPFRALSVIPTSDGAFEVQFEGLRDDLQEAWACGEHCTKSLDPDESNLQLSLGADQGILSVDAPRGGAPDQTGGKRSFWIPFIVLLLSFAAVLGWWWRRRQRAQGQPQAESVAGEAIDEIALTSPELAELREIHRLAEILVNREGPKRSTQPAGAGNENLLAYVAQRVVVPLQRQSTALETIANDVRQRCQAEERLRWLEQRLGLHGGLDDQRVDQLLVNTRSVSEARALLVQYDASLTAGGREVETLRRLLLAFGEQKNALADARAALQGKEEALHLAIATEQQLQEHLAAVQSASEWISGRLRAPAPLDLRVLAGSRARWALRLAWVAALETLEGLAPESSAPDARAAEVATTILELPDWMTFIRQLRSTSTAVLQLLGELSTDEEIARVLFKDRPDIDALLRAELLFRVYVRTDGKAHPVATVLSVMSESVRLFARAAGFEFARFEALQPVPPAVVQLGPAAETRDRRYAGLVKGDAELRRRVVSALNSPAGTQPFVLDVLAHPYWTLDGRSAKGRIVPLTPGEWVSMDGRSERAATGDG